MAASLLLLALGGPCLRAPRPPISIEAVHGNVAVDSVCVHPPGVPAIAQLHVGMVLSVNGAVHSIAGPAVVLGATAGPVQPVTRPGTIGGRASARGAPPNGGSGVDCAATGGAALDSRGGSIDLNGGNGGQRGGKDGCDVHHDE